MIIRNILAGAVLATAPGMLFAQAVLTGLVTDAQNKEALIGATITVKSGHGTGAVTDGDGRFRLSAQAGTPLTLVVSYAGYRSQEIDVYDDEEPLT